MSKGTYHSTHTQDSDYTSKTAFDNSVNESPEMKNKSANVVVINADNARFPLCITWTPLPVITWFLPFIGHTGICGTDGIIHDFAGPYYVSEDDFAFGETHKYV